MTEYLLVYIIVFLVSGPILKGVTSANLKDARKFEAEITYLNCKQICSSKKLALIIKTSFGVSISCTDLFVSKILISLRIAFLSTLLKMKFTLRLK